MAPAVAHLVALGPRADRVLRGRAEFEHVRVRELALARGARGGRAAAGPVAHATDDPGAAALALLREGPTAIVCASDALAIAVVGAARELGLERARGHLGRRLRRSALAAFATPALTSVRVDYAEFGAAAAGAAAGRDRRRAGAGLLAVGAGVGGAGLDRARRRRR